MSKTTIKIDGDKLRSLLENISGKNIYQVSLENGFSKNLISEACRKGQASAIVQNIAKLYGITPEAYKITDPEPAQMSIDDYDLASLSRNELKEIVKEALVEVINDCDIRLDSLGHVYIN